MSPRHAAFTLVELLAAVVILVSLLATGSQKARLAADSVECIANLRASGQAMLQWLSSLSAKALFAIPPLITNNQKP